MNTADEQKKLRDFLEFTARRDCDIDREVMADWAAVDREWMAAFDEKTEETK